MATVQLGREIVSGIILRNHSVERYLACGWDLDWISDTTNPEFASVFPGSDAQAYADILKYYKRFGTVPSREQFEKGFPRESYRLTESRYQIHELITLSAEEIARYTLDVAFAEAQSHMEAGNYKQAQKILEAASVHARGVLSNDGGMTLVSLEGVKPRQTEWLWEERLPLGAISATAGKPGIGKSQFAAWLTAQVTQGTLEGDFKGNPKNVLYVYVEDSLEQTIVPRLMAAGADLSKVHVLRSTADLERNFVPDVARDLDKIEVAIQKHNIGLVVFDPLVSAVKVDRNKSDEVRTVLQNLAGMAERTGVAVHGLMHLRKQAADDMLTMIGGSGDWGAIIRAALGFAAAEDSEDPHTVVSQIKNNLGRMNLDNLAFVIEGTEVPSDFGTVHTSRLNWVGTSGWSAQEVMQQKDSTEARTGLDACALWLQGLLYESPLDRETILVTDKSEQANNGKPFGEPMIKRAAKKIGVRYERSGFGKGSIWSIPSNTKEVA